MKILIRHRILRCLIWVCTVCLCHLKRMLGLYGLNIIRMIIHIIQVLKIADVNETKILKLICMHPFRGISVTDTRMHLRVFSDLHMHFNCDVEMISLAPDSEFITNHVIKPRLEVTKRHAF